MITPCFFFFNLISKMFCNFSPKLNMADYRQVFLALWVRKRRDKLYKRKAKVALTCSFQKVIRTLAFRGRKTFDNSVYFKIPGIV